jgi:hypothetical protein
VDVLVPESFFGNPPLAEDMGGRVDTFCFVGVRARETEGSPARYFDIRLPAKLQIFYSSASEEVDAYGERQRVYTSLQGEVLFPETSVVQSADNVGEIFRALAGARFRGAGYTDLVDLFVQGSRINGAKTGVTRGLMEAIVSEMARWRKDATVPLRIPLAAGRAAEGDFVFAKLRELPRINSVFTGIGFEDINLSVQAAVKKTMSGENQVESPMEELVKF